MVPLAIVGVPSRFVLGGDESGRLTGSCSDAPTPPVGKGTQTIANLTQYGWETRLPLLTGVAEGKAGKLSINKTGITVSAAGVLITAFGKNPDGDGTILRLWEQAGNSGSCTITLPTGHPYKTARFCNLRGESLSKEFTIKNTIDVNIRAFAPVSILLK